MNTQENENKGLKLSDTIFIFTITIFAYALTYNYDLGYKEFYNIPEIFTVVGTEKLVTSILKILASLTPILLIANAVPEFVPKTPVKRGIFFTVIISVFPMLLTGFNSTTIMLIAVGFLYVFIFELLFPLIFYPKVKGFGNKLQVAYQENTKFKSIFSIMGQKYKIISFALIIYFIFIPLAKEIGKKDAADQVRYLVVSELKNKYIVIDKYNDEYIVAPIDINTKTFDSKFKIIDLKSDGTKDIECEWLDIGPIRLKK